MANDPNRFANEPSVELPIQGPLNLRGEAIGNVATPDGTNLDDVVTVRYFNANRGGGTSTGDPGYHQDYTVTAGNTFNLTGLDIPENLADFVLALDGVVLVNGTDYTYSDPTVTFTRALKAGSTLEVWAITNDIPYELTVTFGDTISSEPSGATVNTMNNTIELTSNPIPGGANVYWNGNLLVPATHYTIANGLFTLLNFDFLVGSNDCFTFRR